MKCAWSVIGKAIQLCFCLRVNIYFCERPALSGDLWCQSEFNFYVCVTFWFWIVRVIFSKLLQIVEGWEGGAGGVKWLLLLQSSSCHFLCWIYHCNSEWNVPMYRLCPKSLNITNTHESQSKVWKQLCSGQCLGICVYVYSSGDFGACRLQNMWKVF